MNNTIILKYNEARLTKDEFKRFEKGGLILGFDVYPKELKRWSMDEKPAAIEELKKYNCSYIKDGELYNIEEYALEYCKCDEDGEFVDGSDYELADEKREM